MAAPDLFPYSLPASRGVLTPSGCVHAANPSSLLAIRPKPEPQLPAPPPPQRVSRQASRAGECWSAPILCAGISPLCPPHPCCCTSSMAPKLPPSATRSLHPQKGFLVCGNLSSFTASSHWCRSHPYYFVSVISFFFCPTQVRGGFLAF